MSRRKLKQTTQKTTVAQLMSSPKSQKWNGNPTTIKIADWSAFKDANHLCAIQSEWHEGGQLIMTVTDR